MHNGYVFFKCAWQRSALTPSAETRWNHPGLIPSRTHDVRQLSVCLFNICYVVGWMTLTSGSTSTLKGGLLSRWQAVDQQHGMMRGAKTWTAGWESVTSRVCLNSGVNHVWEQIFRRCVFACLQIAFLISGCAGIKELIYVCWEKKLLLVVMIKKTPQMLRIL